MLHEGRRNVAAFGWEISCQNSTSSEQPHQEARQATTMAAAGMRFCREWCVPLGLHSHLYGKRVTVLAERANSTWTGASLFIVDEVQAMGTLMETDGAACVFGKMKQQHVVPEPRPRDPPLDVPLPQLWPGRRGRRELYLCERDRQGPTVRSSFLRVLQCGRFCSTMDSCVLTGG
jgi:hypothetical protein